jgi:polyisoprenoid-binding protein YceI
MPNNRRKNMTAQTATAPAPATNATTTTWLPDLAHTTVEFSGKHMMISTVRGRFEKFSGVLHFNAADPTQSVVEGTIEAASLDTKNAQRDGHLRSPDFFDVETYPTITFRSTKIEHVKDNHYRVTGDLTIRDVTHPIVWEVINEGQATNPWGQTAWGFSAEAKFNRKNWGLNWNVALEAGGWLVSDEIKVTVETELQQAT